MKSTYDIQAFGKLLGNSTKTLQKWDREGKLVAHRSPQSNRRYYTHDQYLEYRGLVECGLVMDRDENSAHNILARFVARREQHTERCGVLHATQSGVDVTRASCEGQV